jgi:hypothetical protein
MLKRIVQTTMHAALLACALLACCAQASAAAQGQSGYWAQVVARDATVRERPGSSRVVKTLTHGQWFHVYPSYRQNPSWRLGYACPNGNRGCGNRESIPGFILASALSGRAATEADDARPRRLFQQALFVLPPAGDARDSRGGVTLAAAAYAAPAPAPRFAERTVCANEAWFRNDRLWPIQILYRGDRVLVERYTDGSPNDGRARWAIGRAKGLHGRVLVSALCR